MIWWLQCPPFPCSSRGLSLLIYSLWIFLTLGESYLFKSTFVLLYKSTIKKIRVYFINNCTLIICIYPVISFYFILFVFIFYQFLKIFFSLFMYISFALTFLSFFLVYAIVISFLLNWETLCKPFITPKVCWESLLPME